MNTYQEFYRDNIVPSLKERLKLSSAMEVPRLLKITLNMGLGSATGDKKVLESAQKELTEISGQKAVLDILKSLLMIKVVFRLCLNKIKSPQLLNQ